MIKILVIGNGFDKAHGLKTGYWDFLKWISYIGGDYYNRVYEGDVSLSTNEWKESKEFQKDFDEEFNECVEAQDNFWVMHFMKVQSMIGDEWLDFETEIDNFTKLIYKTISEEGASSARRKVLMKACAREIEIPDFANKESLYKWLYEQLRQMTRLLEIYLCKCANKTIDKSSQIALFKTIKANRLLSFNYTSTYQDIYNKSVKPDYIHGKARMHRKRNECDLVLGYDDHYFETVDTIPELIPFEKYYQRIVYRNSNDYFNWVEAKNSSGEPEEKEEHFYGHSLSPADGDIIKMLIEAENTKTKIYYRDGFEQDRANMIKNLVVILTPNELIKRVGGIAPTIEFIPV